MRPVVFYFYLFSTDQVLVLTLTSDLNLTKLQEKIIEKALPDFHKDIVLDVQSNVFKTSSMKAVRFLVRSVDSRCEPVWSSITKKPWGSLPAVGDQSDYVSTFNQIFKEIIPILAQKIEEQKLFRTFCDKLAEYAVKIRCYSPYTQFLSRNLPGSTCFF